MIMKCNYLIIKKIINDYELQLSDHKEIINEYEVRLSDNKLVNEYELELSDQKQIVIDYRLQLSNLENKLNVQIQNNTELKSRFLNIIKLVNVDLFNDYTNIDI